jgi:hypothetical protein
LAILTAGQTRLRYTGKFSREQGRRGRKTRSEVALCSGKQITAWILVALAALSGSPLALAQTKPPSEYEVKAAFLFNFAKFIDWPPGTFESQRSSFAICILGKDPFGRSIDDALQGKSISDHSVSILRVKDAAEGQHCQIMFVATSEPRGIAEILDRLQGANVLLVGESEGFAASGGTIQFTLEDNHVRFLINTDAAGRAGLKVSSKLLALAKIVHGVPTDGKG